MKDKILKLRREGKTYSEIAKELNCARSTVSYHCKNAGIGGFKWNIVDLDELKEYYKTHTKVETAEYFGISKNYIRVHVPKNPTKLTAEEKKAASVKAVQKRRDKVKEMSVEYLGGKCEKCGYNKYVGALEFHHKNPGEKDFGIAAKGYTRSWEKVKKELNKCTLLCSNCHREVHKK